MKLLLSGNEIGETLMSLMGFKEYYWAVAWAGEPKRLFDRLKQREQRIKQLVVGTHFHQTSPTFIQEFRSHPQVRFIVQPSGVFHPKIYLFCTGSEWAAIVGSANFTDAAFTDNEEAAVLFSSTQGDLSPEFTRLLRLVDRYWHQAQPISREELERYKVLHKRWKEAARALGSPSSGRRKRGRSKPLDNTLLPLSWREFVNRVKNEGGDKFEGRIAVLRSAREAFEKYPDFAAIPLDVRRGIAGFNEVTPPDWLWFGSMKGAGRFKNLVRESPHGISQALDSIPLTGALTHDDYEEFCRKFCRAFPVVGRQPKGAGVAVASRLLAMKRPDIFVCYDTKNRVRLKTMLGLTGNLGPRDFDRYWDEVVLGIRASEWWQTRQPSDRVERSIWENRAALLDSLCYQE
jgi:hypothetical protein